MLLRFIGDFSNWDLAADRLRACGRLSSTVLSTA
jgi:hypothetical protein